MLSRTKEGFVSAGSWTWSIFSSGYQSTKNGFSYIANTAAGQRIISTTKTAGKYLYLTARVGIRTWRTVDNINEAKENISKQVESITNSGRIIKETASKAASTLIQQDIPQVLVHSRKFMLDNQADNDISHQLPIVGRTLKIRDRALKGDALKTQLLSSLTQMHITLNDAIAVLDSEQKNIKDSINGISEEIKYLTDYLTRLTTVEPAENNNEDASFIQRNLEELLKTAQTALKIIAEQHQALELVSKNADVDLAIAKLKKLSADIQMFEISLVKHANQFFILVDAAKYGESAIKHYLDYAFYAKWAPHIGASINLLNAPYDYLFVKIPRASLDFITPNYFGQALGLAAKLNLAALCVDLAKSIHLAGTIALESKSNFPAIMAAIKITLKKELKKELTAKLQTILKEYSSDWSAESQRWRLTVYQSLRKLLFGNEQELSAFEMQLQHLIANLLIQTTSKLAGKAVEPVIGSIAMPLMFLMSHSFTDYQTNLATDSPHANYLLAYAYKNTAQVTGFRDYNKQDSVYQLEFQLLAPLLWWIERQIYTQVIKKVGAHSVEKYAAYKMTESLEEILNDGGLIKLFRKTADDVLKAMLLNQAEHADAANPDNPAINQNAAAAIEVMTISSSIMVDFDQMGEKLKQQIKDKTKQHFGDDKTFFAPPQLSKNHRLYGKSVDALILAPAKFVASQGGRVLNRFGLFNDPIENADRAPVANIGLRQ